MANDLNYTRLRQLKQALESDDPSLGEGGVIVIPEPLWSEASEADQEAFAQLAELTVVSRQRLFDLLRERGSDETEQIPDELASSVAIDAASGIGKASAYARATALLQSPNALSLRFL